MKLKERPYTFHACSTMRLSSICRRKQCLLFIVVARELFVEGIKDIYIISRGRESWVPAGTVRRHISTSSQCILTRQNPQQTSFTRINTTLKAYEVFFYLIVSDVSEVITVISSWQDRIRNQSRSHVEILRWKHIGVCDMHPTSQYNKQSFHPDRTESGTNHFHT
jgi:hypothetical protein